MPPAIEEKEIRKPDAVKFAKDNDLSIAYLAGETISLCSPTTNRPGLMLVGYENDFAELRIQLIGRAEQSYLASLSREDKINSLDRFFSRNIPCLILSRNATPDEDFIRVAREHKKTVFISKKITSELQNDLAMYLENLFAPTTNIPGVMMEIYGVGVMITGHSGIGKSETALELLHRGHKLVADDTADVVLKSGRPIASSPMVIKHFMEIRGVGIIDVKAIFGAGSVRDDCEINLVIELEQWDDSKAYERVGKTREYIDILGAKVQKMLIPVTAGRNLAIVLEVAARDYNLKKEGHNSAKILNKRLGG